MCVAVNVSPLQFANPALPTIVTSALAHAGVEPGRLELEITERVPQQRRGHRSDVQAIEIDRRAPGARRFRHGLFVARLSALGPFDKIKIDQSFVRGATQPGSRNGAIIASIVSLAEALGMETTAEGWRRWTN
jgi:EAL domain-containing protein (putative c-di-GMP-specific phosphodiesterase class I)